MIDKKFNKLRFLLVDDFCTMRRIIKNILKQLGYTRVTEAENGKVAFSLLEQNYGEIDFIISDWNMPVISGLEFLKLVKTNELYRHIPFLMVTAEAQQENILDAIQSKVDGYIVKPFTPEVLDKKINLLLTKYYLN